MRSSQRVRGQDASVPSPKSLEFRRRSIGCFSRRGPSRTGGRKAHIFVIRVERATRKNSQLAAARRVALKMGRLLRCSSVTYRSRYAPSAPVRLGPPRRRPILNATQLKGFRRRYTRKGNIFAGGYEGGKNANTNLWCY